VTAALDHDAPASRDWTTEDLDELPEDGVRREIIDGVLIVSPGSVTMDRITKPALYAQAEIPFYWRIETEQGIVVHTHRLDPVAGVYLATGAFEELVETDEPWPIRLPVADFTPRRLS